MEGKLVSKKTEGPNLDLKKFSLNTKVKSILFSLFGIFMFFINVEIGGVKLVPMVHIMEYVKELLTRDVINVIVMLCTYGILMGSLSSRFSEKTPTRVKEFFKKDSLFTYFMYLTSAIFTTMIVFKVGPQAILLDNIGVSSIKVAGDVLISVTVAGGLVAFLLEFGFFEFLGKLIEPIMRKLFKLPGKAAIDALASFVASAAVGVMITNGLYLNDEYTAKESTSITTNFSIASLGAFAYLSATAGVQEYYIQIVLAALFLCFFLAMIMIRIPPLSRKKDIFYSGRLQTDEERKGEKYHKDTLKEAVNDAFTKAESAPNSVIVDNFKSSVLSGIKIVTYVVSLSVISLLIANFTPIAKILGAPLVPILEFFGLADASVIAPSAIVGIFALNIPSLLISGKGVATASAFFIVVLSTSQIIFFTESANAMLDSDMPLSFWELVLIFLLRTAILIPTIALITQLVF